MKLDSIVYDYSTLQSAIANTLNSESPTFQAIYPSDTATSLTNVLAAYGSMLQYQLVSAMANMYTDSAYSEAGIYQLAETLGNRLHGNISSILYCNITRTNLKGINVTIPAGTKFTVENLNFFNPETLVFPISSDTIYRAKLVQGVKLTSEQVASGISGEKIYFCEDFKCNTNMVEVYVNDEEWDITDSFLPYVITDTSISNKAHAVILKTDSDGRTYIKFGNNTNGRIPDKNSKIRIEYVSNEGANGNLNNNNLEINLNTPIYYTSTSNTRERLEVEITSVSTATGGFSQQSIEVLKESSPYVFGSGQRAIRRSDYKAMLLNQCGYLTTNVWGEYEEAAIQGGYDKIMMNMVYYTGIKSIQKYDLQPICDLEIDIADIASTLYTLTVRDGTIAEETVDYTGYYLKKLPELGDGEDQFDPDRDLPLSLDKITADYKNDDVITFKTHEEAQKYLTDYKLDSPNALQKAENEYSNFIITWLDNPADPKRNDFLTYPVVGQIEGARGFMGSYLIDISSYDINNNPITLKYRDRQGTGILTCDPSINSTLLNFESTVFPTNDLLNDKNDETTSGYNFTVTTNQYLGEETNFTKVVVEKDEDYESTGLDKNKQNFVLTFDNPYQILFTFDKETTVGAFAFKTPENDLKYENFIHQFAIYGANFEGTPDLTNVKNNSAWVKLSGMQTFDTEINPKQYSDWITTNVYDPQSSKITDDNVTDTRDTSVESQVKYITTLTGDDYSYIVKVNNLTVPTTDYTLNKDTGELIFINPDTLPTETDIVIVEGTTYNWNKYKYYVIEVYSIHNTALRNPQKVAFRQIKALYRDSLSTINYTDNNSMNLNIPLRVEGDFEEGTEKKVICLPTNMEYYEYKVTLNNITIANGYRQGDILSWSNTIDDINYVFTINIINIATQQYNITIKIDNNPSSLNLRGKSNILVTNDIFDSSSSSTRGTGGTISISSVSTVKVYGSYTGNFYTNQDIQIADLPILNKYNHFTTYIEFKQPLIKNATIEINIEYENVTNYQSIRNNVIAAVNALFDLKPYSIGSSLNVSDIWKAVNSVEGVKRFNVVTPLDNINVLPYELLMLPAENLIINDIINSEYK